MERRNYRYYDLIMAAFVTVLVCSSVIGASKVTTIWGFTFTGGILFFPISYVFGDILTEVYGYARARRVVWAGFGGLAFASLVAWFIVALPPAMGYQNQSAIEAIFGATPRIAGASLIAFCCGEFCNSYVLARMKVFTNGRFLWLRTIGSTIIGEMIDSMIFYPIAFYGIWDNSLILKVMLTNYTLKVLWEVVNTPITYQIVKFLKRVEKEDYYDSDTNFTPFSLES